MFAKGPAVFIFWSLAICLPCIGWAQVMEPLVAVDDQTLPCVACEATKLPSYLENCLRANTARAVIKVPDGQIGTYQITWLRNDLLAMLIDYKAEVAQLDDWYVQELKSQTAARLQASGTIPFLFVVKVSDGAAMIPVKSPEDVSDGDSIDNVEFSAVTADGTRWVGQPLAVHQTLTGEIPYAGPAWGYVLFPTLDEQGLPFPGDSALSAAMSINNLRGSFDGQQYRINLEFAFDRVPLSFGSLMDLSIPIGSIANAHTTPWVDGDVTNPSDFVVPRLSEAADGTAGANGRPAAPLHSNDSAISHSCSNDIGSNDLEDVFTLSWGVLEWLLKLLA